MGSVMCDCFRRFVSSISSFLRVRRRKLISVKVYISSASFFCVLQFYKLKNPLRRNHEFEVFTAYESLKRLTDLCLPLIGFIVNSSDDGHYGWNEKRGMLRVEGRG